MRDAEKAQELNATFFLMEVVILNIPSIHQKGFTRGIYIYI